MERKNVETKLIDKATCPHCGKEFDVMEYGHKRSCPLCKGKIDIFPDADSFISTPWGTFGISWDSRKLLSIKDFLKGFFF